MLTMHWTRDTEGRLVMIWEETSRASSEPLHTAMQAGANAERPTRLASIS